MDRLQRMSLAGLIENKIFLFFYRAITNDDETNNTLNISREY